MRSIVERVRRAINGLAVGLLKRFVPEIDRLPDTRDVLDLFWKANKGVFLGERRAEGRVQLRRLLLWITAMLGGILLLFALDRFAGKFFGISIRYPLLVVLITNVVILMVRWNRWMARLSGLVRTKLNQLGIPTCMVCGYDLRGGLSARCPECGQLV